MNLSQIIKGVRIFQKILEARVTHRKMPILAYFLITSRCNLNCFYCYANTQAGWQKERYKEDMSLDEVKNLIDELYDLGMRWICLMGGEPLLRDDIDLIVDYVRSKNLFCEMITNGFFINEKMHVIKKLDSLVVSIDGNEDGNDLNRGRGSYKKAVEGLDAALSNGVKCRIHGILTRHNKNSWMGAAQLAKERNVPIKFSLVAGGAKSSVTSKPSNFRFDYFLSDTEIKECWSKILSLKKQGFPIIDSDLYLNFVKDLPFRYEEKIYDSQPHARNMPFKCQYGRLSLTIDADGTFSPCAVLFHKGGHSPSDSGVKEAWNKINRVSCIQCGEAAGGGDISILLSMNLGTIRHAAKYVLGKSIIK